MSAQLQTATQTRAKSRLRLVIISAAIAALVAAMALDTKVVKIGSAVDIAITQAGFRPRRSARRSFRR